MIADLFTPEPMPASLQPVEFDFAAAGSAAAALRDAADAVDRGSRMRAADAHDAVQDWTGGQRRVFDRNENAIEQQASTLVRQLRHYADQLHQAAAAARTENGHRAHARAQWHHDQQQRMDQIRAALRQAAQQRG
jgi:uncharacterized protein YukE